MIKNYLKIGFRNLLKDWFYTTVNIVGLSIGIAAMVWAYQNYRFCFSFDDFQPNHDIIYRGLIDDGGAPLKGGFPTALPKLAQSEFSDILETVRFDGEPRNIRGDQNETFRERIHFTETGFFDFFHFPLVSGSVDLSAPKSILITEKMVSKYFGQEDPIGKTLTLYPDQPYALPLIVQGVLKDPPTNSTIRFNFITHFKNLLDSNGNPIDINEQWYWFIDAAFFKILDSEKADQLADNFSKYVPIQNEARPGWKVKSFELMPMQEYAQLTELDFDYLLQRPDDSAAYGPLILSFLLFLSACMNFTNTTVARSNKRLKEIGLRKVLGGTKGQLKIQLILEGASIVILAIFLSITLNSWWVPTFNSMFSYMDAKTDYLNDPTLLLFLLVMLIATTFLASSYPAFYISRFNPNSIFRGSVKFGGNNRFSLFLLGLQVSISLIAVVAGVGFAKNSEFQRTYDYGYSRKNLFTIPVFNESCYNSMRDALKRIPEVNRSAGTHSLMGYLSRRTSIKAEAQEKDVRFYEVGEDFLDIMEMHVVEGRPFDPGRATDFENALLISEKLATTFGWDKQEALGKSVQLKQKDYVVIGVLKDFHSGMLFDPLDPAVMRLIRPERYSSLIIEAKPGQLTEAYEAAKKHWNQLYPMRPFDGYYQDEVAAETYSLTSGIAKIFFWFAIVAVLLTTTGFFALISLTILKRTKEIAIRRVVGASSFNIIYIINKGYIWVIIGGILLGAYAGYKLTKLLLDMIFYINSGINLSMLVFSAAIILIITILTIGVKIWQTLNTNPAQVLSQD